MSQAEAERTDIVRGHRSQLEHKFGSKGARVVEDNIRVVRRGFDRSTRDRRQSGSRAGGSATRKAPDLPVLLKERPAVPIDHGYSSLLGTDRQLLLSKAKATIIWPIRLSR
jgi:hypothetical protein